MNEDPIVAEVRRNRKTLSERYGNNLRRFAEFLRKQEQESEREVLDPGPRRQLHRTGS